MMFAPRGSEMGSMVDILGVGVIIRGESGIGKSECVLALIERGYSLVSDDVTKVTLVDGRRVSAPLAWFPRLLRATPKQRANWRLIGRGIGIHWDDVDEDISIRSLLAS